MNFHNLTGVGAGNIQCYFAGFQRQDIVVAFDEVARFDQKFENKDVAAGARTAAFPAFGILRHSD